MIISNCLFSPTSENSQEFSDWCVFQSYVLNQIRLALCCIIKNSITAKKNKLFKIV